MSAHTPLRSGHLCPNYANADDREWVWRHAFAYADQFTDTERAIAYANHYAQLIAEEDDMNHWPGHGKIFADWRKEGDA